ncbi:MarR family transcriptional regulator [Nakamurella sp. YIM 132087]|uniref:MarR family transcriptional regulator n=2 Tax=Nakamurella alba TaxID=2665158 RepID=A0A7K1FSX2_9ACTN|nr:MarR family transcriptional regulator [Nakamurella alba]
MRAALESRIERDTQRSAGMPHAYYLVLAMLSEAEDRTLRMSQLAEFAQMSQSRLSHAVARLEESGWVKRRSAPEDRRGQLATLTDAGWEVLVAAAPAHAETVRSIMFDCLSAEQVRQLTEICAIVLKRAED